MGISGYPWYDIVEGEKLEQGDIIFKCPIINLIPEYPIVEKNGEGDLVYFDVIVMTQSCDLLNDKLEDIIICPHWDVVNAGKMDSSLAGKKDFENIQKGFQFRYCLLSSSENDILPMNVRIVDFGRIFCLPKTFLSKVVADQGKRLRLNPPYREHLSQSFARFFMRVGLPQDIPLAFLK